MARHRGATRISVARPAPFDPPVADLPVAALRSMFVTEGNSDVAWLSWRRRNDPAWMRAPVMSFTRASVAELWAGRLAPSRHNTSAPDVVFKSFSSAAR